MYIYIYIYIYYWYHTTMTGGIPQLGYWYYDGQGYGEGFEVSNLCSLKFLEVHFVIAVGVQLIKEGRLGKCDRFVPIWWPDPSTIKIAGRNCWKQGGCPQNKTEKTELTLICCRLIYVAIIKKSATTSDLRKSLSPKTNIASRRICQTCMVSNMIIL